jgi:hypothetical protein
MTETNNGQDDTRDATRDASAARSRRYRKRQKVGQCCFQIKFTSQAIGVMIKRGFLQSDNPSQRDVGYLVGMRKPDRVSRSPIMAAKGTKLMAMLATRSRTLPNFNYVSSRIHFVIADVVAASSADAARSGLRPRSTSSPSAQTAEARAGECAVLPAQRIRRQIGKH